MIKRLDLPKKGAMYPELSAGCLILVRHEGKFQVSEATIVRHGMIQIRKEQRLLVPSWIRRVEDWGIYDVYVPGKV